MPSQRWDDSTESLATFSGGVLPRNYITRWDQSQREMDTVWETSNDPSSLVSWFQDINGGQMKHLVAFSPLATAGEYTMPLEAIHRVMCHVVLNRLPSQALPEVWESLNDMAEFYSYEPSPRLMSDNTSRIEATIVESTERPTFTIDE